MLRTTTEDRLRLRCPRSRALAPKWRTDAKIRRSRGYMSACLFHMVNFVHNTYTPCHTQLSQAIQKCIVKNCTHQPHRSTSVVTCATCSCSLPKHRQPISNLEHTHTGYSLRDHVCSLQSSVCKSIVMQIFKKISLLVIPDLCNFPFPFPFTFPVPLFLSSFPFPFPFPFRCLSLSFADFRLITQT